jgi:hypothetical protein
VREEYADSRRARLERRSHEHGACPKRIRRNGTKGEAVAEGYDGMGVDTASPELALEIDQLVAYADAQQQKVGELQAALDARVPIEQAIGMLAERFNVRFVEAFELLRSAGRNSGKDVRSIAEELRISRRTPLEIADVLPRDLVSKAGLDGGDYRRCPQCGAVVPD